VLFAIAFIAIIGILTNLNDRLTVTVPTTGGSFTEGIVGRPGFVNPILAISDTDKDLVKFIFSGLLRHTPNGQIVPDLAQEFSVSDDGIVYTTILREDLTWHDGNPITADDIVFTVSRIQDPLLNSPLQANWEGIEVQKIDDRTISFILEQPYAFFLENLTVGILPEHIWKRFSIEDFNNNIFNTDPIGSGPYKIKDTKRDKVGLVQEYKLKAFSDFALGEPFVDKITVVFFNTVDAEKNALDSKNIDSAGSISPHDITKEDAIVKYPMTRIFGVFFNQNEAQLLADKTIRDALTLSAPKEKIISEIFNGYGTVIDSPLPPGALGYKEAPISPTNSTRAKELLIEDGWTLNENGIFEKDNITLSFSISTADIDELKLVANLLKSSWREIGISVEVKIFEIGDLNQEVIRPREYDALLFGEIIGRDPDLFAFWHSSQRLDPGLNVALYANITVDGLLEDARETLSKDARMESYLEFAEEIKQDTPATFLYAPNYLYNSPKQVKNIEPYPITVGSDRFNNIHEWYINTDTVWKIFR
tara:strand:- start:1632 stop:3233 length:1602 start_codon:yes stop_codon:yes gene_type:complete